MVQSVIEDEAVTRAREEIIRLLLSAGYFRVRMPDLEDFEKVSGGLAWGLKSSSVDVDVNIFFKEKPNVGEKIRISESICAGLRALKCPYELKPHQVQGLDFKALFPVVQWLVKNVIATRNEFGDFQKNYAEFSFNNRYANLPSDVLLKEHAPVSLKNIRQMEHYFPPKRFYKRGEWDSRLSEVKQLETTLLEYGRIPSAIHAQTSSPINAAAAAASRVQGKHDEDEEAENKRRIELKQTLSGMSRETDETAGIDGSVISGFVSAQADLLKEARSLFQENAPASALAAMQSGNPILDITESDLRNEHAQKMELINQRLAAMRANGREVNEVYQQVAPELEELTDRFNEAAELNSKLKNSIKKSKKIIESSDHTDELLRAIAVRDEAAASIDKFMKQCRAERAEWEEKISELKKQSQSDTDGGDDKLHEMLDQYQKEWDRIQSNVAVKAREVLKLRTDYDQVPTIAELTQYDRRLQELSALGLTKLTELRKCHQLYNALVESEDVLTKEDELFNSVLQSFDQAVRQSSLRDRLVSQMNDIAKQTAQRKDKVTQELKKRRQTLAELDEEHRSLLEQQRRYFQLVKEYQDTYELISRLRGDEE